MSINIVVPEVGESVVDARVARWLKKEGDAVAAGEPLVELETDKIDVEVSAPQAGVLTAITRQDGADVKVGEVLGKAVIGPARVADQPGSAVDVPADDEDAVAGVDQGLAHGREIGGSVDQHGGPGRLLDTPDIATGLQDHAALGGKTAASAAAVFR